MGGTINIAIRFSNGDAVCVNRWTNNTPYWFEDPDMFTNEQHAKDYLAMTLENDPKEDPYCSGLSQRLGYSEYGIVVFDYMTNTIIEKNEYSHIGQTSGICDITRNLEKNHDIRENVLKCIDDNRYTVSMWNDEKLSYIPVGDKTPDEIKAMLYDRKTILNMMMDLDTRPMKLFHYSDDTPWKIIKKQLQDLGFPMTQKEGLNKIKWTK